MAIATIMASRPKKPALCALSRIVVKAKQRRPRGAGLALVSTIAILAGNASAAVAAVAVGGAMVAVLPSLMVVSTPYAPNRSRRASPRRRRRANVGRLPLTSPASRGGAELL